MKKICRVILFLFMLLSFNIPMLFAQLGFQTPALIAGMSGAFVFFAVMQIFPVLPGKEPFRLTMLRGAGVLMDWCAYSLIANAVLLFVWIKWGRYSTAILITQIVWIVLGEIVLFLNGIIRIFCCSKQLGMKKRLLLIFCWWIPVVNIILFVKCSQTVKIETEEELEKLELDFVRAESEICKTKYPILLVHGVFFRDIRFFNYWGRVPGELMKNGAICYYGNQQSAATVPVCGKELAERIKELVETTGCEKVNVIAHSKGGLDMRYAIANCGAAEYVATLTTINTPHRGCAFAEYLIDKAPEKLRHSIENKYNAALKKLGDSEPDFMGAVEDLTVRSCKKINEQTPDAEGVYYQSVGSKLNKSRGGRFPLNMSYMLVKYFDGDNDGLVSMPSSVWGERFIPITVYGKRGVSHGDMIDLNRENIKEFDVREFYVTLVADLKKRGF